MLFNRSRINFSNDFTFDESETCYYLIRELIKKFYYIEPKKKKKINKIQLNNVNMKSNNYYNNF